MQGRITGVMKPCLRPGFGPSRSRTPEQALRVARLAHASSARRLRHDEVSNNPAVSRPQASAIGEHAAVHQACRPAQGTGMMPVAGHRILVDQIQPSFAVGFDGLGSTIDEGPYEEV